MHSTKRWAALVALAVLAAPFVRGREQPADQRPLVLDRSPVRVIQDPYPTFNGIAVNEDRGEVILTDDNRSSLLTYPADVGYSDHVTEPLRAIAGPTSHLGYVCTVAISPEAREMYTVDNDWKDNMTVYPLDATGDVAPLRELNVDHGSWGIFLDRKHDELVISIEHVNKVSVYSRTAHGDDQPLRAIQGPRTGLADPHGVFVDAEGDEIFVTNHGHWRRTGLGEGYTIHFGQGRTRVGGVEGPAKALSDSTGKFVPASITVHARDAAGDVAPLRTIAGAKTGLDLPLGIHLDPVSNQIAVVNSGNDAVLFFDRNAAGDAAPVRILKGPRTGLSGPSGVFVDSKRNELWVTNWNNHTATAYPRTASGNVAPTRVIRGAPKDAVAVGLGNPGAVVYDPKRKEILVPN